MPESKDNFPSIPATLSAALKLVDVEGITLSASAVRVGKDPAMVLKQLKAAVRKHGPAQLCEMFPGATSVIMHNFDKLVSGGPVTRKKGVALRPPVSAEHPETIDEKDFLSALQERMCLALSYIDRYNLSNAKLSEINTTLKTLFDVAQIIQGRPTSISHNENMRALKDLVPALMREAERRGIINTQGRVIEVVESEERGATRDAWGTEAHPPGGFESGPVQPSGQSEFSKFISDM